MMGFVPSYILNHMTKGALSNLFIDDCEVAPQCSKFLFLWNGKLKKPVYL